MANMFSIFLCLAAAVVKIATYRVKEPLSGSRVLYGTTSTLHAHPYIVKVRSLERGTYCTGFILSPKLVMTANHCFTEVKNKTKQYFDDNIVVEAGSKDRYNDPITYQERNVWRVVRSEDYSTKDKDGELRDDVAILILDEPLDFNEEVQRVEISRDEKSLKEKMQAGYQCLIIGYGISVPNDGKLRGQITYLLSDETCKAENCLHYQSGPTCDRQIWENGQICTKSNETSLCPGDSGSPLICDGQVHGVAATGRRTDQIPCLISELNFFMNFKTMDKVWEILRFNKYYQEIARFAKYRKNPNAPERAHPFVVKIRSPDRSEPCLGTIIHKNLVLTACHCVRKNDGSYGDEGRIEVTAGKEPYIQKSKVMHVIPHKNCARKKVEKKSTYSGNIALLILDSILILGETVKSINVGNIRSENEMRGVEEQCVVYGYGRRLPGIPTDPLKSEITATGVFLTTEEKCQSRFCKALGPKDVLCTTKKFIHKGILCAKSEDLLHCSSHSGGPVVCSGWVFGVDSIDLPCTNKRCLSKECYTAPSLFENTARIRGLLEFVKKHPQYGPLVYGEA